MSKIVRGIRKVFKRVVKALKKVVPIVLAVAAIYFTAGAALGWAGAAGGISGAVATVTAGLGEGIVAGVVRGALVSAAKGAAIGGISSAVTGRSVTKGMQAGATIGAVTGGISGGLDAAKSAAQIGPGAKTFPLPATPAIQGQYLDAAGNVIAEKGGLLQAGGWLERNQGFAGDVVKGLGVGMMAGAAGDAETAYLREKFRLTRENYAGTDPGRNYRSLAPQGAGAPPSGRPPANRFDPSTYGSFEYEYDPAQGKIVKVPVT